MLKSSSPFVEDPSVSDPVAPPAVDWSSQNGFMQAGAAGGVVAALMTWLIGIYRGYQGDAEPKRAALLSEIKVLEARGEALAEQLKELRDERAHPTGPVAVLRQQEKEALDEAANPAPADVEGADPVSLVGSLFLLGGLSFYLVVFYISAGYSAFFKNLAAELSGGTDARRVEAIFSSIFDVNAMSNALAARNFFVLLFPVIFLGLGFVIHRLLDERRYVVAGAFLLVALGFDVQLAYLIAGKLFGAQVLMGLASGAWGIGPALRDADFWAVILGGFVVYIVWTFVLGFLWREIRLRATCRHYVNERLRRVEALRQSIRDAEMKRESDIASVGGAVAENRQRIAELQGLADGRVVYWPVLEDRIESFVRGWQDFIVNPTVSLEERARRVTELRAAVDAFKDEIRRGFGVGSSVVTLKGVRS